MVPVKSFMVPIEKFITVDRDMDARSAAALMRDRNIGSLFVTRNKEIIGGDMIAPTMNPSTATVRDCTKTTR